MMTFKNKIGNGAKDAYHSIGKLTHKKKDVLSEEKMKEIYNKPLSKAFNNVIEKVDEEALLSLGIVTNDILKILHGESGERRYLCSIYASYTDATTAFEKKLPKKFPPENISKIGALGFWHYFIESSVQLRIKLLNTVTQYSEKKIIDVVEKKYFVPRHSR